MIKTSRTDLYFPILDKKLFKKDTTTNVENIKNQVKKVIEEICETLAEIKNNKIENKEDFLSELMDTQQALIHLFNICDYMDLDKSNFEHYEKMVKRSYKQIGSCNIILFKEGD